MGKPLTNFLDRAVSFFNPQAGMERVVARARLQAFDYDGSKSDGRRGQRGGTLFRNSSPESSAIQRDAIKLMWESRDMEQNFCLYRGMLTRTVQYALGTIRWQSRTGDSDVDSAYEQMWENWCKQADITGRHHFNTLVRLGIRSMMRDRDFGFALSDENGELRVKGIEADRIGNPSLVSITDERNIQGVKLGEKGEVTGFEIFKRTRNSMYELDEEVPVARFLHVFDPLRVDQYRGVAWAAPALPHMRDLYEALDSEMQAIKFASSFSAFTTTTTPYSQQGAAAFDLDKKPDGGNKMSVQAGTIQRLAGGESIVFPPGIARPSGAFMAFFEAKVREIAVGVNVPFGFVWNLALLGGVTARIEVAQMKRTLDHFREIARDKMLEPLKDRVLRRAVARGEAPPHPKRGAGRWGFGAEITGDAGNDMSADIAALQAGIFSESYLIEGKYGGDFDEHVNQQAREINVRARVAEETGVPIELQSARLQGASTQIAAMNSRGDPEAEAPVLDANAPEQMPAGEGDVAVPRGLAAAHGKDAVKGLIEVMKQMNRGEIDREQAVTILVATYGLDLQEAEAVIPEV